MTRIMTFGTDNFPLDLCRDQVEHAMTRRLGMIVKAVMTAPVLAFSIKMGSVKFAEAYKEQSMIPLLLSWTVLLFVDFII